MIMAERRKRGKWRQVAGPTPMHDQKVGVAA